MAQVGNININFTVFSDSPLYISIADLSDWLYAQNLPAYLSITIPGSKKPKVFSFTKERINIFNSHNLGLSCLTNDCTEEIYNSLPDGIYTVCLKSGYENIEETKFYLKTDRFNIEYSKVMIKDGIEYNKDFIEYMMQVKFLVEVAKSHAMLGDFVKAQRFFEDAKKKLKKYVECKNCI